MRPWAQAFAAFGGKPAAGLFRYVEESALSHEGGKARIFPSVRLSLNEQERKTRVVSFIQIDVVS